MKKKLNIALLIVIAIVYGAIAYKYFGGSPPEAQLAVSSYTDENLRLPKEVETLKNNFVLTLSERDPFLDKTYRVRKKTSNISSPSQNVERVRRTKKNIEMHWPMIHYLGFSKGSSQSKKMAVLRIDGKLYRKREGSTVNEMKILKIADDSIYMMLPHKEKKYFYRNAEK